nr:uncharacterized protein LOC102415513 isoform X4 [Bubalus bubalis]
MTRPVGTATWGGIGRSRGDRARLADRHFTSCREGGGSRGNGLLQGGEQACKECPRIWTTKFSRSHLGWLPAFSFSTALKLDMPYNMRFSWSGSKSIFQRTGCMLHNLQQASVDPQLNDGVGEGDRGEGGEAAREPASKRTKCCRLFLGMRFIFIFHTSGTIVYILPGFQM